VRSLPCSSGRAGRDAIQVQTSALTVLTLLEAYAVEMGPCQDRFPGRRRFARRASDGQDNRDTGPALRIRRFGMSLAPSELRQCDLGRGMMLAREAARWTEHEDNEVRTGP
jgi:hypothetical protein